MTEQGVRVTSIGAGFHDTHIVARLEELERKFEESPHRYFASLANEYRKAGEPQRAADMCRAQLAAIPGHISGHIVLGQALYDSGDFDGSRAALERALILDPENIVALRYLGDIARDTGDTEGAESWYTRTLEADPYNEAATAALQAMRAATPVNAQVSNSESITEPVEVGADNSNAVIASPDPTLEPAPESASDVQADDAAEVATEVESDFSSEAASQAALEETPEEVAEPATDHALSDVAEDPDVSIGLPAEEVVALAPEATGGPAVQPASAARVEAASEATPEAAFGPAVDATSEVTIETPIEAAPDAALEVGAEHEEVITTGHAAAVAPEDTVDVDDSGTERSPVTEPPPQPEFEQEIQRETFSESGEFAGDLEISAASEQSESFEATASELPPEIEVAAFSPDVAAIDLQAAEVAESAGVELVDVAPHPLPDPVTVDDLLQEEERVMESAAPFVTETMADLYLEQGYPHEALELLLQLSEQRPDDQPLRDKIETVKSVITARRDAAVAAARAERAEAVEAEQAAEASAVPPADAPETSRAPEPPAPPPTAPPRSVRELFARMDGARPRSNFVERPRPAPRLRSDFVPVTDAHPVQAQPVDDPFGFPHSVPPTPPTTQPSALPRTSGPHPTFDPSTAALADFDAWLRGLRGP